MDTDTFRQQAHVLVDWMADFVEEIESYPVKPNIAPDQIKKQLPQSPPEDAESFEIIFKDFVDIIMPGMTHWQHPNFFAYFPTGGSLPSVLAEMLISILAAQCMSWQTSPAATELETQVMSWLRDLIGLPKTFSGVIQDSASSASLCALLSARESSSDFQTNWHGMSQNSQSVKLTVYCSDQAHSSIDKAMAIAGFGRHNLRKIAVDDQLSMKVGELEKCIQADIANNCQPICVIATLGTTATGSMDNIMAISACCKRYKLWLHVDAAWAGNALIIPDYQYLLADVTAIDSLVFNPHKWLLTHVDCSAYFVKDEQILTKTLAIAPEYLKTVEADKVINYRDWSIPLGRRFRALKLWFVLRSFGIKNIQTIIANHIAWAKNLADNIQQHPDFEMMAPVSLSLCCFRYHPQGCDELSLLNQLNANLLNKLNDSGKIYLSHAKINEHYIIRFSVGAERTTEQHVKQAWQFIQDTAVTLNT